MNVYYVYAYLDPRKPGKFKYDNYKFDYEPFYIGKGKGNRYKIHLGMYDNNNYKNNKIRKIINNKMIPIILKISENLSEEMSIILEKDLIKLLGRKDKDRGPLVNFTDGGEGISGYKFTNEYLRSVKKRVIKYDIVGNILDMYETVDEASIKNNISKNSIIRCCNGSVKFSKNKDIYLYDYMIFKKRIKLDGNKYPVVRIDQNGIKEIYKSLSEASIKNSINESNIGSSCRGLRFQTGGYIWRYYKHPKLEYYTTKIENNFRIFLPFLEKEIIDIKSNKRYKNILEYINIEKPKTNKTIQLLKRIINYEFKEN